VFPLIGVRVSSDELLFCIVFNLVLLAKRAAALCPSPFGLRGIQFVRNSN